MIVQSVPMFIGDKSYYLRFEIADMGFMEDNFGTLMKMFDPKEFGYKTAAKFLLVSCYDKVGENYIHHFPQHQKALDESMVLIRDFTGQFQGATQGLAILYATVHSALVASGWFKAPGEIKTETPKVDDIKNSKSPEPILSLLKSKRLESVVYFIKSMFTTPQRNLK